MPERTGRMAARFEKGKGWKLLISVQFLSARQPSLDNKEISVPFRITQQATARAAAESLNKGTFGTELGPKTCPVSHFPALATLHLSTADQDGCHQKQPRLTWSNRLDTNLKGCEKWKQTCCSNVSSTLKIQQVHFHLPPDSKPLKTFFPPSVAISHSPEGV